MITIETALKMHDAMLKNPTLICEDVESLQNATNKSSKLQSFITNTLDKIFEYLGKAISTLTTFISNSGTQTKKFLSGLAINIGKDIDVSSITVTGYKFTGLLRFEPAYRKITFEKLLSELHIPVINNMDDLQKAADEAKSLSGATSFMNEPETSRYSKIIKFICGADISGESIDDCNKSFMNFLWGGNKIELVGGRDFTFKTVKSGLLNSPVDTTVLNHYKKLYEKIGGYRKLFKIRGTTGRGTKINDLEKLRKTAYDTANNSYTIASRNNLNAQSAENLKHDLNFDLSYINIYIKAIANLSKAICTAHTIIIKASSAYKTQCKIIMGIIAGKGYIEYKDDKTVKDINKRFSSGDKRASRYANSVENTSRW